MLLSRSWLVTSQLLLARIRPVAASLEPQLPLFPQHHPFAAMATAANVSRAPAIVFSHGGGPMPLLGDPTHKEIVHSLQTRVPHILRLGTDRAPRAIALVTAHWSEPKPTISSGLNHSLYYDYYGFPPESYKIKYDAPGSPDVAHEIAAAMREEGLEPELDDERGWDHGVFVPMILVNPAADIPIVQLSVLDSESPADHFAMGRALAKLRDSNVAIVGSGFASLHNIRAMMSPLGQTPDFRAKNVEWGEALSRAMEADSLDEKMRVLDVWRSWPHAYQMHPRGGAEHFLPLIVAAAAGGDSKAKSYKDSMRGFDMFSFYWD